jgi:hypothetical protein
MPTAPGRFEYYSNLHNTFNETYASVNLYVMGLYALPRKFIMETGPVLDRFLKEYTVPGAPKNSELSKKAVLEFIGRVDVFTVETIQLFEEHKNHVHNCREYMHKVAQIQGGLAGTTIAERVISYVELTPELLKLHNGILSIQEKAKLMVIRLEKLELGWRRIRTAVE